MNDNWVILYTTNKLHEAEIMRQILSDNEIDCVILNKMDSAYGFGDIEVCVPAEKAFDAKQITLGLKGE
jgi:adenylosuccinate synthase